MTNALVLIQLCIWAQNIQASRWDKGTYCLFLQCTCTTYIQQGPFTSICWLPYRDDNQNLMLWNGEFFRKHYLFCFNFVPILTMKNWLLSVFSRHSLFTHSQWTDSNWIPLPAMRHIRYTHKIMKFPFRIPQFRMTQIAKPQKIHFSENKEIMNPQKSAMYLKNYQSSSTSPLSPLSPL